MSRHRPVLAFGFVFLLAGLAVGQDRPDLVVADFEAPTYQPWVVEGNAFGTGPARGPLPGQMAVEGFEGKGLVNSFSGGDDTTGTITSPPFRVERRFVNFLIGGGKYPGETCLQLLIDGSVVREATGPNDSPGGSERLEWGSWDVGDLAGKSASLRIVDHRKGGWGHIAVDQIVQSDGRRGIAPIAREMAVEGRLLLLPVDERAPKRIVKVGVDGKTVREFDIKLAEQTIGFWTSLDLEPFRGKTLKVEANLPFVSKALDRITQGDALPDAAGLYHEPGRPQFHFTARRGWLNDPNGLVYFDGEYHLFFQHNPYGWEWGNMHWGHAVSPDLVHWSELPIAVYPYRHGDRAFSGSAVVDAKNTSGFGVGDKPPLVAAYTSTGRGECILYSNDRGRTWSEFAGNPVVKHEGRDPRLFWHEPSKHWVMAVYDEEGGKRDVVFHTSPDLKAWTYASRIGGFYECPDLFELPVEGEPGRKLWVISAADGQYRLGQFDGKTFTPEPGDKLKLWYGHFYAAQTFSDEPKGRRVQIGWGHEITFPGRPFNQQMTVPCELTLKATEDGVRLATRPVAEIDSLRTNNHMRIRNTTSAGKDADTHDIGPATDLMDIQVEAELGTHGGFKLDLPRAVVAYDLDRNLLTCNGKTAPLQPIANRIKLRLLVDQGSIEIFANDGIVAISQPLINQTTPNPSFLATDHGQGHRSLTIDVYPLKSSWR